MSLKILKNHITPAKDKIVIDPLTNQPLPPEGKEVALNTYWRRRLKDGDVHHTPKKQSKKKES
tara:strand:+ start:1101 stop:1289 length:189 start_codon:yes stop_codon:yes gene_type:complete